jgi:hypothetical protein
MSELDMLLQRLRRTETGSTGFADWKASEEALGHRVADKCILTQDKANKLCDDILTVILYFVNNMSQFSGTITELVQATIHIIKTRELNHSVVVSLMTALEHFSTVHEMRAAVENRAEWEKVNTTLWRLTNETRNTLQMPA